MNAQSFFRINAGWLKKSKPTRAICLSDWENFINVLFPSSKLLLKSFKSSFSNHLLVFAFIKKVYFSRVLPSLNEELGFCSGFSLKERHMRMTPLNIRGIRVPHLFLFTGTSFTHDLTLYTRNQVYAVDSHNHMITELRVTIFNYNFRWESIAGLCGGNLGVMFLISYLWSGRLCS